MQVKTLPRIHLNISGESFETHEETLSRFPDTLLGNKGKREKYYCSEKKHYFFNRHRRSFDAILYFYQSFGRLTRPVDVPMDIFVEECEFFQLSSVYIKNMKYRENFITICSEQDDLAKTKPWNQQTILTKLWIVLEEPEISVMARYFSILLLSAISLSVISTIVGTIPDTKKDAKRRWYYIDLCLNTFFLVEIMLRIIAAPSKYRFFKSAQNWIDLVAVLPFFANFVTTHCHFNALKLLRMLRTPRVLRLFHVSRGSKRLKAIRQLIVEGVEELFLLFLTISIILFLGASFEYVLEANETSNSTRSTIDWIWWAVQTLSTVGYGDITPKTFLGRVFAAVFMTFGAITVALPVLAFVMKFASYCSREGLCRKHPKCVSLHHLKNEHALKKQ